MKMNSFNTNAHDFRSSKRICSSLTGCLIFVLLMSQTSCRPSETDTDNGSSEALTYNDQDYMDPDETDWKTFAAVETTSKVHPIIFYKEDIVSEDYDPIKDNKNKTTKHKQHHAKEIKPHHRRKYKEISRHHRQRNQTESFRYIKPEKVYFDINPIEHRVKEEPSNEDDTSLNEHNIDVEIISLVNEEDKKQAASAPSSSSAEEKFDDSKHLLNKKPKKFHHRYRRDVTKETDDDAVTNGVSLRHKRNPFYHGTSHYANQLPHYRGVFYHPQLVIYPVKSSDNVIKHPVKSPNYYNAYSPAGGYIVNRRPITPKPIPDGIPVNITDRFDDSDRPVWPIEPSDTRRPVTTPAPTRRTMPPRRTQPPILQFGDEDYVTSAPAAENRNSRPGPVSSSSSSASASSSSGRGSAFAATQRPSIPSTTRPPVTSPAPARGISACIWAISSCCTRSEEIRYQCFERLGCSGAFWDLNPCADNIVRLAVQAVDQYLD